MSQPLKHTKTGWAWQNMGGWCLVGQHGHRPIVLNADIKTRDLRVRDFARDLMIPFNPAHDDARLITLAPSAPHVCADPACPGDINRRKLEAFNRLLDALDPVPLDAIALGLQGLHRISGDKLWVIVRRQRELLAEFKKGGL